MMATGDRKSALIYIPALVRKGTIILVMCPTNFLESNIVGARCIRRYTHHQYFGILLVPLLRLFAAFRRISKSTGWDSQPAHKLWKVEFRIGGLIQAKLYIFTT